MHSKIVVAAIIVVTAPLVTATLAMMMVQSAYGVCSPKSGACASSSPVPNSFTASHHTIALTRGNEGGPAAGKQPSSQGFSEAFAGSGTQTPCAGSGTHGLICAP